MFLICVVPIEIKKYKNTVWLSKHYRKFLTMFALLNLQPLQESSFAIQLHVGFAIISFFVGIMIFWRRKGNTSHKRWGKFWVLTMAGTALTSFFINEIRLVGLFSPIHLISIFTLISLYMAIKYVLAGKIAEHQRVMKRVFVGGMLIAGGLTFLPGRIMHQVTIDPLEAYFNVSKQGEALSLNTGIWLMPILASVFGILFLYRKAIIERLRSR